MKYFIVATVSFLVVIYLLQQCRKPSGWVGRFFLWIMSLNHFAVTDWGLTHVQTEKGYKVLDLGCGSGKTISIISTIATQGRVCGIDYSRASVQAATRRNKRSIRQGRVQILQASVAALPYANDTFDLVTAVETHYYWPNLHKDMREILQVLKPGGKLIIIAETYKRNGFDPSSLIMKLMQARFLDANQHRALFLDSGYSDVVIVEEKRKGWICVVGKKPGVSDNLYQLSAREGDPVLARPDASNLKYSVEAQINVTFSGDRVPFPT